MTDTLKPLRTWSHLVGQRRRPSEYEIVSTGLLWHARGEPVPFEIEGAGFMNDWVMRYRDNSPITHDDWDSFRDPDEMVYRTYNILQDGQEAYVDGLADQYDSEGHDGSLPGAWLDVLETMYTPGRYLIHTTQMASAYLVHMAPASTICNCAAFQTADALRWLSRIAYRTASLAKAHPDRSFGDSERATWESAAAWQGYRELMERVLTTCDWAEAFVALNLVALPAVGEGFHRAMALSARRNDDTLLALMAEAALRDSDRSGGGRRPWSVTCSTMTRIRRSSRSGWTPGPPMGRPLSNPSSERSRTFPTAPRPGRRRCVSSTTAPASRPVMARRLLSSVDSAVNPATPL